VNDADAPTEIWSALIAAVTDPAGRITGAHRTWLDPMGEDKAPVDTPEKNITLARRALIGIAVSCIVTEMVVRAKEVPRAPGLLENRGCWFLW